MIDVYKVRVGVRVKSLRKFSGVEEGTEGVIDEIYGAGKGKPHGPFKDRLPEGFMVAWDLPDRPLPEGYREYDGRPQSAPGVPLRDGFSFDEREYLEAIAGPYPGGYWHGEAFHLMTYECEVCGDREQIWNSRDGVTPFAIPCKRDECNEQAGLGVPMTHVDWHLDKLYPEFCCHRGMRIFVDIPETVSLAYARIQWNEYLGYCEAEGNQPVDPENGLQRIFENNHKDGRQPWVVTL